MHLLPCEFTCEFRFEVTRGPADDLSDVPGDPGVMTTCAFYYVEENTERDLDALPPGGGDKSNGTATKSDASHDNNCQENEFKTKEDCDIESSPVGLHPGFQSSAKKRKHQHRMANVAKLLVDRNRQSSDVKATFFLPDEELSADADDHTEQIVRVSRRCPGHQHQRQSKQMGSKGTMWDDLLRFLTIQEQDNDDDLKLILESLKTSNVQHSHLHVISVLIGLMFGFFLAILLKT